MNGPSFIIIRHSHCLTLCPSLIYYSLLLPALHPLKYRTTSTFVQLVFLKKILHTAVIFCGVNFTKFMRPNENNFHFVLQEDFAVFGLQVFTHTTITVTEDDLYTNRQTSVPVFVQGHITANCAPCATYSEHLNMMLLTCNKFYCNLLRTVEVVSKILLTDKMYGYYGNSCIHP